MEGGGLRRELGREVPEGKVGMQGRSEKGGGVLISGQIMIDADHPSVCPTMPRKDICGSVLPQLLSQGELNRFCLQDVRHPSKLKQVCRDQFLLPPLNSLTSKIMRSVLEVLAP